MLSGSSNVAPHAGASAIRAAAAIVGGFALLAAVNAAAVAIAVPLPSGGVPLRLAHHAFDAAETLGVGALLALVVAAFVRFVRLPAWAMGVVSVAAATAVVYRALGEYLGIQASHLLDGRFEAAILVGLVATVGAGIASAPDVASRLARRPGLRFVPLAVAIAVMVGDQIPLRDDYESIHCLVAWGAALLAGPALAPLVERAARALARSLPGKAALAATALFALGGLVVPPPNAARFELFRQPCAVASWVLASTVWSPPRLHGPAAPLPVPWLDDRTTAPPVPRPRRPSSRATPWSSSSRSTPSAPTSSPTPRTTRATPRSPR